MRRVVEQFNKLVLQQPVDERLNVLPRHVPVARDARNRGRALAGETLEHGTHAQRDRFLGVQPFAHLDQTVPEQSHLVQ